MAVLFQVWELTGSPVWVGAIGVAQAVPLIVLGLLGGSLADAVDRRRLVLVTTVGSIAVSVLLAAQAVRRAETRCQLVLGLVAGSAACSAPGRAGPPDVRARGCSTADQVAAGIALTHLGFQAAMLIGPAVAGLVIAGWGLPVCYLLDAVTFGVALYGVARPAGDAARSARCRRAGDCAAISGRLAVHRPPTGAPRIVPLRPGRHRAGDAGRAVPDDQRGTVRRRPTDPRALPVGDRRRRGAAPACSPAPSPGPPGPASIQLAAAGVWGAGAGRVRAGRFAGGLALPCLAIAGAADTVAVISRGAVVQLATTDAYRGRVSSVEQIVGVGRTRARQRARGVCWPA